MSWPSKHVTQLVRWANINIYISISHLAPARLSLAQHHSWHSDHCKILPLQILNSKRYKLFGISLIIPRYKPCIGLHLLNFLFNNTSSYGRWFWHQGRNLTLKSFLRVRYLQNLGRVLDEVTVYDLFILLYNYTLIICTT